MLFIKPQFPFNPSNLSNLYKKEILFPNSFTVIGFVVNIYDAVNYDIDLQISQEDRKKIIKANYEKYQYNEYHNYELVHKLKDSCIYRCRIYGIGVNRQKKPDIKRLPVLNKIKRKIDNLDGWIVCEIVGIDNYNRILANIYIPEKNENDWEMIDIKDMLLEKEYFYQLKSN